MTDRSSRYWTPAEHRTSAAAAPTAIRRVTAVLGSGLRGYLAAVRAPLTNEDRNRLGI